MTEHLPSDDRKLQIIEAALSLLAEVSIDRLTTRDVAAKVGVSQPALFRHFGSRDALLEAVADATRERLGAEVERLLKRGGDPLETLSGLSRALFRFASENPGVPRLLFFDAARSDGAAYHPPLRHLVTLQKSLVAEMVGSAIKAGEVPDGVDPEQAATMFVALIQGTLLQWHHLEGSLTPDDSARRVFAFFRAALEGGEPAGTATTEAAPEKTGDEALVALDVRPNLARGEDPLREILGGLELLAPTGALLLLAPFRPTPLITLLNARGFRCECRQAAGGEWFLIAEREESPEILDLRELEAPEPMERILERTAKLAPGGSLLARLPRVPRLLLPHLKKRGLAFQVQEVPDGSALLSVRRRE